MSFTYSVGIDPNDVKQNGYDRWLGQLKLFLEETLDEDDIEDISRTVHSVQFTYKEWIEVDLLVSPKWDYPADLYNFLGTVPKHRRFRYHIRITHARMHICTHACTHALTCTYARTHRHIWTCTTNSCTLTYRFSVNASLWQVEFFQDEVHTLHL